MSSDKQQTAIDHERINAIRGAATMDISKYNNPLFGILATRQAIAKKLLRNGYDIETYSNLYEMFGEYNNQLKLLLSIP